uniref:Uncharacterized protein n=1 Tax=Caulobacter sp. (strain K31) TaxID=366602 RepID=B0T546_CAUSK
MSYVERGIAFRERGDGRNPAWLLLAAAFNLVVWSGLIMLIVRAL